ncbi:MAG: hypothetical protein EOO12_03145 [Chitinophagaceae bacterium]|nr:MAG: hypothetical protein EOO12_03145 [Chitinophagaceae bacterium]
MRKGGTKEFLPCLSCTAKDQKTLVPLFADHPTMQSFGDAMTIDLLRSMVRDYNENRDTW